MFFLTLSLGALKLSSRVLSPAEATHKQHQAALPQAAPGAGALLPAAALETSLDRLKQTAARTTQGLDARPRNTSNSPRGRIPPKGPRGARVPLGGHGRPYVNKTAKAPRGGARACANQTTADRCEPRGNHQPFNTCTF